MKKILTLTLFLSVLLSGCYSNKDLKKIEENRATTSPGLFSKENIIETFERPKPTKTFFKEGWELFKQSLPFIYNYYRYKELSKEEYQQLTIPSSTPKMIK